MGLDGKQIERQREAERERERERREREKRENIYRKWIRKSKDLPHTQNPQQNRHTYKSKKKNK